jgi:hypothetical protein
MLLDFCAQFPLIYIYTNIFSDSTVKFRTFPCLWLLTLNIIDTEYAGISVIYLHTKFFFFFLFIPYALFSRRIFSIYL